MNPEWDVILSASQKNRPDLIRDFVNRGIPPNHANAVGQSGLHIASLWGHVDAVRVLVELGANVNAQNGMTGATPLHMVAQSLKGSPNDRLAVMDLLIEGGAAVDLADNYGSLPVQLVQVTPAANSDTGPPVLRTEASETLNHELLQAFIAKLQPKRPALHTAILNRDLASVESHCATSAGSSSCTNISYKGVSPLSFCVNELLDVVQAQPDENEMQHLVGMVELLLTHGADVQGDGAVDEKANAAMLMAGGTVDLDSPLTKVVNALRDAFKANATTPGTTCDVVISSLTSVVTLLVNHGATVSPDATLLLHQAARFNERPLAEFLIDVLHVDPNTKGRQGLTPLHFAARSGKVEMVTYLVSLPGIDVTVTDDRGNTALDAAKINQKDDVVRLLECK